MSVPTVGDCGGSYCDRITPKSLLRSTRPCTLGFLALALCVFLWGFGYKLSLYHAHNQSHLHVSVAKLWIEPRQATPSTDLAKAVAWAETPCACLDLSLRFLHNISDVQPRCTSRFSGSLLVSRAPPAFRFALV